MTLQLLRKIIELAVKWGSSLTVSEEEVKQLLALINQK